MILHSKRDFDEIRSSVVVCFFFVRFSVEFLVKGARAPDVNTRRTVTACFCFRSFLSKIFRITETFDSVLFVTRGYNRYFRRDIPSNKTKK